ncbi:MAG: Gfo/Idh/MocA family oxidoreductase [Planctomycetes bacterium]|nr:Gfo/Idh/MocA family oxidoreductase [Planctomycetota bacterium]
MTPQTATRRDVLLGAAALPLLATTADAKAEPAGKVYRIGVISATIRGKPQPKNGHTWHFAQYLHPEIDLDAIKKYLDPGSADMFRKYNRNPKYTFDQLPFPDARITLYYDADPKVIPPYLEAFPGVKAAKSVEEMVEQVDAVWLGDASGFGEDHFDLIAPALKKGLPTFCDKPIGGSVAGTRKILEFAKKHNAPIMSSSLFRHEWGMEAALRRRDSGDYGPIRHVVASQQGGYSHDGWMVYGQHPAWTVVTLLGPKVEAVSLYAKESTAHALITYPGTQQPASIWYGRPNDKWEYCHTEVYFEKKKPEQESRFVFTPSIEGDFWYGHHYEMFRMAATFREMVKTRKEPIPHDEIIAVTALVHAGAKSLKEKSRLVDIAEVSE